MFAPDVGFHAMYNLMGLKGNTGVKSGAVPATVIHITNC